MRALPILLAVMTAWTAALPVEAETQEAWVVINEVLYDPFEEGGEWVELYNPGPKVNLEGFDISDRDGHIYVFPNLEFPSDSYLLLRVGPGEDRGFENGSALLHMGRFGPVLNNDGDDLLLKGLGRFLDFFCYGRGPAVDQPPPQAPWEGCAQPAPEGLSLSLQANDLTNVGPNDWRASVPTPGGFNGPQDHQELLLSEVYYNARRDNEYIALYNQRPHPVNMAGWRLQDGEGAWVVPVNSMLLTQRRFIVTDNATALFEDAGIVADVCVVQCNRTLDTWGSFRLGNQGDDVELVDPSGAVVDAFHYGPSDGGEGWEGDGASLLATGRVARRRDSEGVLRDSDTATDWEWERTFRLGQTYREVREFDEILAKPFTSPEDSLWHLLRLLNASQRDVLLYSFKLTSGAIAEALEAALGRGVRVEIGVEGNPPGGVDGEQESIVARLGSAGARILTMDSDERTGFRRYAVHHAKYVIVDGVWVLLGSENFSDRGFPAAERGNRGWGVVIFSPALASSLSEVARSDWNIERSDVRVLFGPQYQGDGRTDAVHESPFPRSELSRAAGRLILSPDNALSDGGLPRILKRAEAGLDVELFYVRWDWRGHGSPLLGGLIEAAGRGVRVRLLLDGSPYNIEGEDDNDEAVIRLNRLAAEEGLPLEARIFGGSDEGPLKLHNKGLIADGREVFVSSINWNFNGAYENRETGLHLFSAPLAAAYQRSFEDDWRQGYRPAGLTIRGPELLTVAEEGVYSAEVPAEGLSVVRYAWDLHADGTLDGAEPTFSFTPTEPGVYPLLLRVEDDHGRSEEVRIRVTVIPAGNLLPVGPDALIGVASAMAAYLLFGKLRIAREPTNKQRFIKRRGDATANRRGRD